MIAPQPRGLLLQPIYLFLFICFEYDSFVAKPNIVRAYCASTTPAPADNDTFYLSGYQALQKKRRLSKSSRLEWKPEALTMPETQWISGCAQHHEVLTVVNEALKKAQRDADQMCVIFNCAIRKCVSLSAYPQCWALFVLSKRHGFANTQLYTTMIWMCLNSEKRAHFEKALSLYSEMKNSGFAVSCHTYTALINGCARRLCHTQGISVWQDLQSDEGALPDVHAWNAVITLHAFRRDMAAAAQCYADMEDKAHVARDGYTWSAMLNGYAAALASTVSAPSPAAQSELLDGGEDVFFDAVMAWRAQKAAARDAAQRMFVVSAWMNMYAAKGDVHCALAILRWLLSTNGITFVCELESRNKRKRERVAEMSLWLAQADNGLNEAAPYPLKVQLFGIALKACLYRPQMREAALRRVVAALMHAMQEQCGIAPSTDVYGILFQLYRRMDGAVHVQMLRELERLYEEMKTKCANKPTERELNEYAKTYLKCMQQDGASNDQKQDFLSLLMSEFRALKVTPSVYTQQLIREYSV